jgi:prefoldin subunit 5
VKTLIVLLVGVFAASSAACTNDTRIEALERKVDMLEARLQVAEQTANALRSRADKLETSPQAVMRANRFELIDAKGRTRASLRVEETEFTN